MQKKLGGEVAGRVAANSLHLAGEINLKTNTTEFPLDHANLALQQLKQGKINAAAVLTVPN